MKRAKILHTQMILFYEKYVDEHGLNIYYVFIALISKVMKRVEN
jgi:hypothetical protein